MPPSPPGQAVIIRSIGGIDVRIDDNGNLGFASGDVILGGVKSIGALNISTRRLVVTNSPQQIATKLADRRAMRIINISDNDVYLSESAIVSSGDGWPIFAQTWQDFVFGPNVKPYLVAVTGNNDCRIQDVA